MKKGSEILLDTLISQGVDTVFGFPGGAVIPLYDTLYDYKDKITHILCAHEQGATHAADGYARSTGRVGVVFATSGPGATNTITGIANAYLDSIPMVVITGQVSSSFLGKDSFQEIDISTIVSPITKNTFLVTDKNELESIINRAFEIAKSNRQGPVLVDIPKDIFTSEIDLEKTKFYNDKIEKRSENFFDVPDDKVMEFARYINSSKKPLIYAGGGVISSNTYKDLRKLVGKNIPVVLSLMARGAVSIDEKLNLGHVGMHGYNKSNYAVEHCDLLIALGTRFSDRVASNVVDFAKDAKLIQVDISNSEIGKNMDIDYSLNVDLKFLLPKLVDYVKKKDRKDWIDEVLNVEEYFNEEEYSMKKIFEKLSDSFDENTIVATDVGQHQMWTSQFYKFKNPRKLITSAGLGTMGFGLGAAIGSKVGNKDCDTILITGDGSFRMNLNELATVSKYDLKILIVVVNNHALGMVRQWQEIFQNKRYSETIYEDDVDFVKLADAYNILGRRVKNMKELESAIEDFKNNDKAMIIDLIVDRNSNVYPMIPAGGSYKDIILN